MSMAGEQVEEASGSDELLAEARRIVDEAHRRGLTVRLVGGLAVREQCRDAGFCRRPYRDIDLVCLRPELKAVTSLLTTLGFTENPHYRLASSGRMAQFFRPCIHRAGDRAAHVDDRVDLFVDAFRLDHEIPLKRRLALEHYTAPASDVLLVKLQRASINEDDLADVVALLKDLPLIGHDVRDGAAAGARAPADAADGGGDAIARGGVNGAARSGLDTDEAVRVEGAIDVGYLARLCARDWGLHHDVTRNLARCRANLARFELGDGERRRALDAVTELEAALRRAPKSLRWRLRSLFGEAFPWHDTVDEREGVRIGHLEGV
jgi:hypothetical protein